MRILFRITFAVALVLVLTATGLWADGAEEEPAAAADKQYVTDPTTGKVVVAPQYGGILTAAHTQAGSTGAPNDPYFGNPWGPGAAVNERLGIGNWGIDRDVFDFKAVYLPLSSLTGRLAESWDISQDGLTYTFNIRQGR